MSEQNPLPEPAHPKDQALAQSARPARTPQAAPAASTVLTPFNFLLISGLAYLVLQSSEFKLDSTELFQKGLAYFSEFTGNGGSGSGSESGLGLYAICSKEGNQIYTSELDTPQVQCVLVNNDTIIGLGAQGQSTRLPLLLIAHTNILEANERFLFYRLCMDGDDVNMHVTASVEETAASLKSDVNPGTKDFQVYYVPEGGIMTPVRTTCILPPLTGWFSSAG
jgi:hypothetical protein